MFLKVDCMVDMSTIYMTRVKLSKIVNVNFVLNVVQSFKTSCIKHVWEYDRE